MRWLAVALLLSSILHGSYFLAHRARRTPDSAEYVAAAESLRRGEGFRDPAGRYDTLRTPAYPLLLAAFPDRERDGLLILLQHLLAIALVGGAYALTLRAGGRTAANVAALLTALDLSLVSSSDLVMTETLFCAVLWLLLWLLTRREKPSARDLILAALVSGLLTLIRPIAFFLPWMLAPAVIRRPRGLRAVATFLLAASLLPALWIARNQRHSGVATISSIAGKNMLYWRAAGTIAMHEVGPFVATPVGRERDERWLRRVFIVQRELARSEPSPAKLDTRALAQLAVEERRRGEKIVLADPLASFASAAAGSIHLLFDGGIEFAASSGGLVTTFWTFFSALHAALEIGLILGLFFSSRRLADYLTPLLATLYFVLISAGPEAYAYAHRFHAPIAVSLAVLAGLGWSKGERSKESPPGADPEPRFVVRPSS